MVHLYLEHCLSISNQSASKVAGSRKAPKGLKPLDQPWGRFRFGKEAERWEP
jgi:hypothetical protein